MLRRLFSSSAPSEHGPSSRAVDAAVQYYSGLYQDKDPDPEGFALLVSEHGVPDWPNPYPTGEPEHYLLHPDGFMFADLQAILEDILDPVAPPEDPAVEDRYGERARVLHRSHMASLARQCWAIALARASGLERIARTVHPDNLSIVNMDVMMHVQRNDWPHAPAQKVQEGVIRLMDLAGS